jgi:6-phosphogluconolactonase
MSTTIPTRQDKTAALRPGHPEPGWREGPDFDVYVGTYTKPNGSKGIYHTTLDLKTGVLSPAELAYVATDPTFLEIHPNNKFIYAVTERNPGAVSAFAIDTPTRKLTLLNTSPSGGQGPCHVCVSGDGSTLLVANYAGGSVASISINPDGSLAQPASIIQHSGSSVNPKRQNEPHVHSVTLSPDNRFAYVADLGLDKLMIYRLNPESSQFHPNDPAHVRIKPGAGPRHFSFGPTGQFAYLINELDNTVIAFAYDSRSGGLSEIQTISTLPEGYTGASDGAEVRIHPGGKFLYGSNRGHDSIAIYAINPDTGRLTLSGFQDSGIKTPRNFNIEPTGQFCIVANQDSNTLLVFHIHPESGMLEPTGQAIPIGAPVCVRFLPRRAWPVQGIITSGGEL